jgi:acetyl-CoA carboxylase biotin carboxyl carrier protein
MVDIEKIEKLMLLMSKHGFDVVQAESHGEKFSLARNASHAGIFSQGAPSHSSLSSSFSLPKSSAATSVETHVESATGAAQPAPSPASTPSPAALPQGETIASPFVGTFYRSPGPDSPAFVSVGSKVKKGQSLCIVEAMKLMNEIECEMDGEVVAILVENAKPVEFGTPLFIIDPSK